MVVFGGCVGSADGWARPMVVFAEEERGGPAVYYAATTRRPDLTNRFLFITGNVDDPEPWRFLAKIRAHVLEKPFTGRALRHALIKVIA